MIPHRLWNHSPALRAFCVCEFLNLGDCSTSTYDPLPPRPCKSRGLWWSCMSSSVSRYLPGRGGIAVPSGKETCSGKWPADLCSGKLEPAFYCEAAHPWAPNRGPSRLQPGSLSAVPFTPTWCVPGVCAQQHWAQDDLDVQEQKLFFTTMKFYWITWMLHWICLERCDIRQILLFFCSKNQIETPLLELVFWVPHDSLT